MKKTTISILSVLLYLTPVIFFGKISVGSTFACMDGDPDCHIQSCGDPDFSPSCNIGTATSIITNADSTQSWICPTTTGGIICGYPDVNDQTPTPVNGICGTAITQYNTVPVTANLCSLGTASAVIGNGPWSWTCNGSNGGTTASCSVQNQIITPTTVTQIRDVNCVSSTGAIVDPSFCTGTIPDTTQTVAREVCNMTTGSIVGACGILNGGSYTAPRVPIPAKLCAIGNTASIVAGNGPWSWSCTPTVGGTPVACGAQLANGGTTNSGPHNVYTCMPSNPSNPNSSTYANRVLTSSNSCTTNTIRGTPQDDPQFVTGVPYPLYTTVCSNIQPHDCLCNMNNSTEQQC